MEFTEIANIQRDCKDAMLMWGYTIYKHSQEMETKESFGKLSIWIKKKTNKNWVFSQIADIGSCCGVVYQNELCILQ